MMLLSTYQHDYVPPRTRRYDFIKGKLLGDKDNVKGKDKEECQCIEEVHIEPPKAVLEKCADIEWTGIAPMGRLIDPRIIPAKMSPDQIDRMAFDTSTDCNEQKPNRFLKILRTAYPDLYERLKEMPKHELGKRLDAERMFTTYQIDYCNMNEYPEGVYESLKQEEDDRKMNAKQLLKRQGPCDQFRAKVMEELDKETGFSRDPCEKLYTPFNMTFADSTRFTSSGDNSHWRAMEFKKSVKLSEYMDSISRGGCVILKNNLHNHANCIPGKHCKHEILHTCPNFK